MDPTYLDYVIDGPDSVVAIGSGWAQTASGWTWWTNCQTPLFCG